MRCHARAFVAVAALHAALASAGAMAAGLAEWTSGPIRYIATTEELKTFRKLKTDEERAAFIERFWSRRDPSPGTLSNENRQLFWERVRDANARFTDSSAPGWKTDRGKILILYGPPTEVKEDLDADTKGLPTAGRGLIRWIYEGRPDRARKDLDPIVVVPFVRDATGEWRMSHDPRLSSVFFDWSKLREHSFLTWDKWLATNLPTGRSDLAVMLDQGRLQEVPSQEEVLIDRVETFESYGSRPLDIEVDRIAAGAVEGRSLAILTVPVPAAHGNADEPTVIARFVPHDSTRKSRTLAEGSFRIEGDGLDRVAQGRLRLEPGLWSLTVLVADPGATGNALHHSTVEIPAPPSGLTLSDVILAATLEPATYASLASYDEPYYVGAFRVVPRVGRALHRGEPLQVFFEIYGGQGPYGVAYQLEGMEDDGRWTSIGHRYESPEGGGSQGWSIPTGPSWPLGDYRVRIEVKDSRGSSVETLLPFRLDERPTDGIPPA